MRRGTHCGARGTWLAGLLAAVATAGPLLAQDVPERMQPIDAYLLDAAYEVALAQSAAPARISGAAQVLVLTREGYREARAGTNGFVCLVERSWSSPIGLHEDFFNPRLRAPICYNAEGARTTLGDYLLRTELALGGKSITEIDQAVQRAVVTGRLQPPRTLAMSFMLSGGQLLGTQVGRFVPHLMFYVPYATNEQMGHVRGTECYACLFEHAGGPLAAIVVPVAEFIEPPPAPGTH